MPTNALVRVERRLDVFASDPTWQRLWLNLETENWRSLAFVPADEISSIEFVNALAAVAWQQRSSRVVVADFRAIELSNLAIARDELHRRVDAGDRVLVGLNSPHSNPTSATLARDADRTIICVIPGRSSLKQVRATMSELGTKRCLGAILIRNEKL